MTALLAGLALGAASSGHCVAMCGPLVLSVGRTLRQPSRRAQLRHATLYHLGRLTIYLLLAVVVGCGGGALAHAGLGRILAIVVAVLLLDRAFGFGWLSPPATAVAAYSRAIGRAASAMLGQMREHTIAGSLIAGAINGVMPCGLVYAALTAAAATGTMTEAMAVMAGFGLGTTPLLIALTVSSHAIPARARPALRRLVPVALVVTAAVVLFRAFAPVAHDAHVHGPDRRAQHASITGDCSIANPRRSQ